MHIDSTVTFRMSKRTAFESVFILWFVLHIPITVLVDAQSILPASWFPKFAKELVIWHVKTNSDWLVSGIHWAVDR